MNLFTPVAPLFPTTKMAAVPLDEDSAKWPSQILQELFRQAPDTSEYNPRVVMMRQDPEQGFALGVVIISGQTDSALSNAGNQASTSKKALVPIIVKNNELCPLDIIMTADRRCYPLNGVRLREALFRPNTFDMMTDDQGDQSLYSMFYPPGRSSNSPGSGMGGGGGGDDVSYVMGPGMKSASKTAMKASVMGAIAPTLSQLDLDELSSKVAASEIHLADSPPLLAILTHLAGYDGKLLTMGDADILMDKAASQFTDVDVAQFGWDNVNETYWVKQASRSLYGLHRDNLDRGQFQKLAGEEMVEKVDQEGTVTVAEPAKDTAPMNMSQEKWAPIEQTGIYKVRSGGNEFVGWVLPSLVDFDGTRVPLAVFTNGAVAAIQETIIGVKVADPGLGLPSGKPQGTGLFYLMTPGGIEATVPLKIMGSEATMDGANAFHAVSLTGQPIVVKLVEGLQAMIPGEAECSLPASARFLPLANEAPVPLMDDLEAVKQANFAQPYIAIRHGGDIIDLTYHGLPGLQATSPKVASIDDAVFTLCAAGMAPPAAHEIIKMAERTMSTEFIIGVHDVRPVTTFMAEVEKTASEKVAAVRALRHDLLKEAAVLPDIQTVDSVLSLNYLNPENIRIYVGKLPYLDRALNTVCELTLFSRLGMSEVPEHASARASRALDDVIQGLKGLAMRNNSEEGTATAS